ncbi:hypothetical protein CTAYLR_000853 [Chrysophaeum taylorii]|uniref:Polygalacturonase n=1 Tax=Chrysophaeum taylorii TaxID=2483200 RepID=A0AAD7XS85_9STRA|nr:hypothetical protein CTAYLR_000853 [Chrysophaeum taylorii]
MLVVVLLAVVEARGACSVDERGDVREALRRCTSVRVVGEVVAKPVVVTESQTLEIEGRWRAWPTPDGFKILEEKHRQYQPVIDVVGSRVRVTGGGVLDGQGDKYWWHDRAGNHLRPPRLLRVRGEDVEISRLHFINSPFWTIHLFLCRRVTVTNVTITNIGASQTDGVDVDSCEQTLVDSIRVTARDDAIAYKATMGVSRAHVARRVYAAGDGSRGGSLAVGSETNRGISDVLIESSNVENASAGILIKTRPSRGGYIRNILFRDIKMARVHRPLYLDAAYGGDTTSDDCCAVPPRDSAVDVTNITFNTIHATPWDGLRGATLVGTDRVPFRDLHFRGLRLNGTADAAKPSFYKCCCAFGDSSDTFPPSLARPTRRVCWNKKS